MASLMHTVTGRKRESDVWQHFQYLDGKKKSKCIVSDNKGKICGFEVCGKNPTNLKSHIRCRHEEVYASLHEKEQEKVKSLKRKREENEEDKPTVPTATASQAQTISDCVNRRKISWSTDSIEYKYRLDGILQMLISSGRPVTMVDDADYRESTRRLDPKFSMPGTCAVQISVMKGETFHEIHETQ